MREVARNRDLFGLPVAIPAPRFRRLVFLILVAGLTGFGVYTMWDILASNGLGPLEAALLGLFGITFLWIAGAFCTAVVGFLLDAFGIDPLSLRRGFDRGRRDSPIIRRTAVIMPAFNEDTDRVIAGLEATYRSLRRTGPINAFDFYLLSDSNDPEIAAAEETAWRGLVARLGDADRLFYRRRTSNEGKKPGNIAEFCKRWGAYYDYMIVLDADSLMTGHALTSLVRAMQANPDAGLIQTVPIPIRQETVFGRFVQFAGALYNPLLAAGLSFWQTDTANYWGHNAILRVRAFMDTCGLPKLPGKPPLGGEILSHDFVEAAFLRRGGWHVYLFPELGGSYEEVPPNILDFAKRDRRWTQGNLQHLKLVGAHGLHPLNRIHFIYGALAYGCSLLWLLMLIFSTADAVIRALSVNDYFGSAHQLFPDWPIAKTGEIMTLLGLVIAMLVLPKVLGVFSCLINRGRRRAFGGAARVIAGALVELVFSVAIAPMMMIFHAYFVASILCGRNVRWGPQVRDGCDISWPDALRRTAVPTVVGLVWAGGTLAITPIFFLAMTPVFFGLVLAAPLVHYSSSSRIGKALRRMGVFVAPSETRPPAAMRSLRQLLADDARPTPAPGSR